ncbi:MAG: prepilin-type N-terminal cleavage/methylation domain-containing protein [Desulfurivibrio sp.]|nr:prepilin-type N-terminal cleavage/methylation domain-containing protein [Desulfurivibrio sp.]
MNIHHNQRGFTLVEVMVALTLLAVGIAAAGTMQISALGASDIAIRITDASTLASATMEELISEDYDDLTSTTSATDANYDTAMSDLSTATSGDGTDDMEVFWNIADDYPITDTKAIRVIVRRSDKGVMRTITLDYIMRKP